MGLLFMASYIEDTFRNFWAK